MYYVEGLWQNFDLFITTLEGEGILGGKNLRHNMYYVGGLWQNCRPFYYDIGGGERFLGKNIRLRVFST